MTKQNVLDGVDMRSANEAVLIANTPSYLFDALKKDVAVQTVAETLTAPEILSNLARILSIPPESPHDLVAQYVYLVALSIKDPKDVWPALDQIDMRNLEWGDQIRSAMKVEFIPTTQIDLPGGAVQIGQSPDVVGTSTSRSVTELSPQPGLSRILT